MAELKARIDRVKQIAVFFGPGTFAAKEQIKRLGPAFWLGEKKAWEVRSFSLSEEELRNVFPEIVIEEIKFEADEIVIEKQTEKQINGAETPLPLSKGTIIPEGISVSELSRQINVALLQAFPRSVFVRGVLTKVTYSKERVFLTLADSQNRDEDIDAVIWQNAEEICKSLTISGFKLEADLEVMFEVQVRLRNRGARISLHVIGIVAEYTIGKLAAIREQTNERLKKEGIFDQNKRLTLPFLPKRIGILTSTAGTVINDFRACLEEAQFAFHIFWIHSAMQGKEAKGEIISGLKQLTQIADLDAIVIIRGGGSPSDLAVFSDYEVAKAICLCPLPTLTAIGHEADQSSAQDVSFRAFGVPKAVGHFFAEKVYDLRRRFRDSTNIIQKLVSPAVSNYLGSLQALITHISSLLQGDMNRRKNQISHVTQFIQAVGSNQVQKKQIRFVQAVSEVRSAAAMTYEKGVKKAHLLGERLYFSGERVVSLSERNLARSGEGVRSLPRIVNEYELRLDHFSNILREVSPEVQLRRGFALIKRKDSEEYVTSGQNLHFGEVVRIEFYDTKRVAVVKE